jgi:trans-aconitate methyltransferase
MDQTKQVIEVFNTNAFRYQQKFGDLSSYHDTFDLFCNAISVKDPEILEVACGPGNITKYILSKRPDFRLLGIDLAPNMLELAKFDNPQAKFLLMDARKIKDLPQAYDGIICGFCLPYLSKEEAIQFIADSSDKLNSEGVLYISTMEDDNSKSSLKTSSSGNQLFMNYHEEGYLVKAMENNSMSIIDVIRKNYVEDDGTVVVDMIIVGRKR